MVGTPNTGERFDTRPGGLEGAAADGSGWAALLQSVHRGVRSPGCGEIFIPGLISSGARVLRLIYGRTTTMAGHKRPPWHFRPAFTSTGAVAQGWRADLRNHRKAGACWTRSVKRRSSPLELLCSAAHRGRPAPRRPGAARGWSHVALRGHCAGSMNVRHSEGGDQRRWLGATARECIQAKPTNGIRLQRSSGRRGRGRGEISMPARQGVQA